MHLILLSGTLGGQGSSGHLLSAVYFMTHDAADPLLQLLPVNNLCK